MARTGAFTNWVTLSSDQGQMPEGIEAVTIERPAGGGTYDTFYYATQETTYRLISPDVYVPRLKSIGSIVSQLGKYEYCMLTIAVSPPCMYSIVSTPPGSSHPVPVGVATTKTLRSNPPTRFNSSTAINARDCRDSADLNPT